MLSASHLKTDEVSVNDILCSEYKIMEETNQKSSYPKCNYAILSTLQNGLLCFVEPEKLLSIVTVLFPMDVLN